MTPERLDHVHRLAKAALGLPPGEQGPFLENACGDDADLLRRALHLLHKEEVPAVACEVQGEPLGPGHAIGPYRIQRELGFGGMGVVFLANREDDTPMKVALKVLKRGMDRKDLDRFQRERRILAGLKHANIAQLHDSGTTPDGRPFFVMEYVEGEPIDRYCDRCRLDIRQRLRLFAKVCAAVSYAHQNLIIHRDLKPANILVTTGGEPKLLEFRSAINHY